MAGRRVHFVMPADLVERIDAALLDGVSRGEFVRRAVERALSEAKDVLPVARAETWDEALPVGHPARVEQPVTPVDPRWVEPYRGRILDEPSRHAPNCKCPVCS